MEVFNALRSPPDSRDWIYEKLACGHDSQLEEISEFDLSPMTMPDRHQGMRETCAAFVGAHIKEINEKIRNNKWNEYLSPEFIYFHRENKPASGMFGRNLFQILQRIGVPFEREYKYRSVDNQAPVPSDKVYASAMEHRIANYARITTVDGLKRALRELGACYILLPQCSTKNEFWEGNGEARPHAVVVIGYNLKGFVLKNSWGGDGKNITFPYSEWARHYECWVSIGHLGGVVKKKVQPCIVI